MIRISNSMAVRTAFAFQPPQLPVVKMFPGILMVVQPKNLMRLVGDVLADWALRLADGSY